MPAPKVAISREQVGTRAAFAIQQQSQKLASAANLLPRQGQVTIYSQTFVVGTNATVIHGLGRPIVGWAVVRPRNWVAAAGTVTQCTEIASDNQTLTLGPFAGFVGDVEVW